MLTIPSLENAKIRLEPLQGHHGPALTVLAKDMRIWAHNPFIRTPEAFEQTWLSNALRKQARQTRWPLVIIDRDQLVGSTSFYDYDPKHRRISIGYTWYHPSCWGSGLNQKVKTLMLNYAFHALQCERVAFCIDSQNKRSCAAVEKLGAIKEGLLRHHMQRPDQTWRDTVCYSILAIEWAGRVKNL